MKPTLLQIISHRGFFSSLSNQNSIEAFKKSFDCGFGIETDIRDHYTDNLILSHDPFPKANLASLDTLFELASCYSPNPFLALNVKSDGLACRAKQIIEKYNYKNYAFFDASIPDTLKYLSCNLYTLTRQSEYELNPCLYEQSSGIWIDQFREDWITEKVISEHMLNQKSCFFVSPELHSRDPFQFWNKLRQLCLTMDSRSVYICTDLPTQAEAFFTSLP